MGHSVYNHRRIAKLYTGLGAIVSGVFLVVSLLSPSEIQNSFIFGYSLQRLALTSIFLICAIVFCLAYFLTRSGRFDRQLEFLSREDLFWIPLSSSILFIVGLVLACFYYSQSGGFLTNYLERLLPFSWWLMILAFGFQVSLAFLSGTSVRKELVGQISIVVILTIGAISFTQISLERDVSSEDVFYTYVEGQKIIHGENPYARVVGEDVHENDKYAIYFPGFYLLSGASQAIGLENFEYWIAFWEIIFLSSALTISVVIFMLYKTKYHLLLSLFGPLFFLFNRWTLHVVKVSEIDFLPLLILILALIGIKKGKSSSYLLFGLSLCIKQMGIFLVPLTAIWAWKDGRQPNNFALVVKRIGLVALIPTILILPFLVWDAEGFFRSVFISVTRNPSVLGNIFSLDAYLGFVGFMAKLPMILLFFLVYFASARYNLGVYFSSFLIFIIFAGFNSVYFPSNFVWVIPFIPLSLLEFLQSRQITTEVSTIVNI